MPQARSLLAAVLLASAWVGVALFWQVFWDQLDPWLRRELGRRLGVEIVWFARAEERVWRARDGEGRQRTVDGLAVVSRLAAILAPVGVVTLLALAARADGALGRALVVVAFFSSAFHGRRAPRR